MVSVWGVTCFLVNEYKGLSCAMCTSTQIQRSAFLAKSKPFVVPRRIVCVELSVSFDLFQAIALIRCPCSKETVGEKLVNN